LSTVHSSVDRILAGAGLLSLRTQSSVCLPPVVGCDTCKGQLACLGCKSLLGFQSKDSNLYRYIDNEPTHGTDPSGLRFVFDKFESRLDRQVPTISIDVLPFPNPNKGKSGPNKGDDGIWWSTAWEFTFANRDALIRPKSVEDMVDSIKREAGNKKIVNLCIRSHGDTGSIDIANGNETTGTPKLNANIIPGSGSYDAKLVAKLAELKPKFAQALANLWGVRVGGIDVRTDTYLFTSRGKWTWTDPE
jgi:hypothetical protein